MKKFELLAPAGDIVKLKTAVHFGADAIYLGGQNFGLRAGSKNFNSDSMKEAVDFLHSVGKKIMVTANIYADNKDFAPLLEYLKFLNEISIDAVIVSDPGVVYMIKNNIPTLNVHLSTQANTTNKYAAKFWHDIGVERVVLAREMSLDSIKELKDFVPDLQIEAFVHGAMCMAYSGRCLLSNYLTSRNGNRGECVQACRWEWSISEKGHNGKELYVEEDANGTYLMNSKDLNMIEHLGKLMEAGVDSFKIEGRMKTQYYVANVINAYRMAIDYFVDKGYKAELPEYISYELEKIAHRDYTNGFYFGKAKDSIALTCSQSKGDFDFIADVLYYDANKKVAKVQQRNRFKLGDELEILSSNCESFNKKIIVKGLKDLKGNDIDDAKIVQQELYLDCEYKLSKFDLLRKRIDG